MPLRRHGATSKLLSVTSVQDTEAQDVAHHALAHCSDFAAVTSVTLDLPWSNNPNRSIVYVQILPRHAHLRLLASMYTALVPMAGAVEAEEAAAYDYQCDSGKLPAELAQIGVTRSLFSDSLFGIADNVSAWLTCAG